MQVFDVNGKYLRSFGNEGNEPGQFRRPRGIALDRVGNVLVCDQGNDRVQIVSGRDGSFITQISGCTCTKDCVPWSVHVTGDGRVLVGSHCGRIEVFAFPL